MQAPSHLYNLEHDHVIKTSHLASLLLEAKRQAWGTEQLTSMTNPYFLIVLQGPEAAGEEQNKADFGLCSKTPCVKAQPLSAVGQDTVIFRTLGRKKGKPSNLPEQQDSSRGWAEATLLPPLQRLSLIPVASISASPLRSWPQYRR